MEVVLDHQEERGSSSAGKMQSQASLEAKSFDGSVVQMSTCSDEHVLKIRKPYTITKQRERWTEDEHNKFLEALKLYGRAWRRIEEHVGTKTAVQIRSHAQKFFSKVTRDSTGNFANGTTIEIPPPRPKRKPMHAYPRKLCNLSTKGTSDMQQQERSASQVVCAQENGSPKSVLSGIGSSISNFTGGCTSPSSTSGSTPAGMSPNDKEKCQSHSPSDDKATKLLLQLPTSMEHDLGSGVVTNCDEDQLVEAEAAAPTIKLFGRTVLVTDPKRPSSLSVGDANCDQSVPVANAGHDEAAECDGEVDQGIDSSGASKGSVWNPWIGSVQPICYYMPMSGNLPSEPAIVPFPCWSLYGASPLPFVHAQNPSLTQSAAQSCIEAEDVNRQPKEGSSMGSNTGSVGETGPVDRSSEIGESRSTATSLKFGEKAETDGPCKGFVPYKRSSAQREPQQFEVVKEEGDCQRIRLSL